MNEALPGPGMTAAWIWLIVCFVVGPVLILRGRTLAGFMLPPLVSGITFLILGWLYHPDYRELLRVIPVYFPLAVVVFAIADSFRNPPRTQNRSSGYIRGTSAGASFAGSGSGVGGASSGGFRGGGGGFGGGGASGGW